MASLISPPGTTAVDRIDTDASGRPQLLGVTDGWRNFFGSVFNICNALTMSGTTANRPVKALWTGRFYFDTTLGKPLWYSGSNWILSDGTVV